MGWICIYTTLLYTFVLVLHSCTLLYFCTCNFNMDSSLTHLSMRWWDLFVVYPSLGTVFHWFGLQGWKNTIVEDEKHVSTYGKKMHRRWSAIDQLTMHNLWLGYGLIWSNPIHLASIIFIHFLAKHLCSTIFFPIDPCSGRPHFVWLGGSTAHGLRIHFDGRIVLFACLYSY